MPTTPNHAESSAPVRTAKTAAEGTSQAVKSTGRAPRILGGRAVWLSALVLAVLVFAVDQGTKYLVVTQMQLGERITVIDGLLWWYSIRNSGAAFSMGENVTWIFTLVMVTAAIVVLYLLRRTRSLAWTLSLGGLLGGICGNLFDRLFREPGFGSGHVVDFISVPNFAIFNVADSAICVCMALIVLLNFMGLNLNGTKASQESASQKAMSSKSEEADGKNTDA